MPIRRLDSDGVNQVLNQTDGKSKNKIQRLFWEQLRQRLHSSTIGPSGNTTMKTKYDLSFNSISSFAQELGEKQCASIKQASDFEAAYKWSIGQTLRVVNGPLVQKGTCGWSSLLLSFLHQIPRTSTNSRTTPKHAFGTIQEMIAKETEIKFSSTINELFIAPKFKSNSTSLSEVEPSGGEKFQNSISTVIVSRTHTQNAKKIRIYYPLRFRFLVILNIGSLFVIFCLT